MTLVVTAINSQTLTGHKQGPVISVEVDEASSEGVDAYFSWSATMDGLLIRLSRPSLSDLSQP